MLGRKVGVVLAAMSVAGILSSCTDSNNDLPAATATSTTIPPPSASSGATSVPQGVSDAKVQWIQGSCAASAEQGMYWQNAATDLVSAEAQGGEAAAYAITAAHLRQLITLPDMGLTPTQSSEYRTDISDVNLLFHTPGLYLNASGTCPNT